MIYIVLSLLGSILFTALNVFLLIKLNKKLKVYNLDSKKVFKSESLYTNLLFILQFILYAFSISFINHVVFYLFISLCVLTSIMILSFLGEMNTSIKTNKKKD